MSGTYEDGVWMVTESFWWVSGILRCLRGIWKVSLTGQVRTGQFGTGQVGTDQVGTGHIRRGHVRTGQVRICEVNLGQVQPSYDRSSQDGKG